MKLKIELLSDGAFGRGDGVPGLVDSEVEHDAQTGLPFIKGRTVKGLLVESCANILYALCPDREVNFNPAFPTYEASALKLFGRPGSTGADTGSLHIGPACLPDLLYAYIRQQTRYEPQQILQALTTIRNQTAVDYQTDRPEDKSLRATRVVLRGTTFYSDLTSTKPLESSDYQLLAACAAGIKRGGQSRTRGLGRIKVSLESPSNSQDALQAAFNSKIGGGA